MRVRRPELDPEVLRSRLQPGALLDDHTRISAGRWDRMGAATAPGDAAPGRSDPRDDGPPALPVPGRHAAAPAPRRVLPVPDGLRGRVAVGPGQVAVLAVVVAVALALLAWWVLASRPTEVAAPRAATTEVAGTPMAPADGTAAPGAAAGAFPAGPRARPPGPVRRTPPPRPRRRASWWCTSPGRWRARGSWCCRQAPAWPTPSRRPGGPRPTSTSPG
ncbi:hypothetical protein ACOACO_14525 [Nocardioides sp. CPCC 205120]|uniref:hypothetical protein n=1 Tax=Nocardioides sp. CPCC 205120 TaxID=3406462 RepID=UPI003B50FE6D